MGGSIERRTYGGDGEMCWRYLVAFRHVAGGCQHTSRGGGVIVRRHVCALAQAEFGIDMVSLKAGEARFPGMRAA